MLFSILASDAIALPLSPAFPAVELRYILDNSDAKMLLATERYASKARELVESHARCCSGLDSGPIVDIRPKIIAQVGKSGSAEQQLTDIQGSKGGLMLYTSGTTNRPVRNELSSLFFLVSFLESGRIILLIFCRKVFFYRCRHYWRKPIL